MTYFMRTIPDVKNILGDLDKVIDNEFILAITEGHICTEDERKLMSLPVKLGGGGLASQSFLKSAPGNSQHPRESLNNLQIIL